MVPCLPPKNEKNLQRRQIEAAFTILLQISKLAKLIIIPKQLGYLILKPLNSLGNQIILCNCAFSIFLTQANKLGQITRFT